MPDPQVRVLEIVPDSIQTMPLSEAVDLVQSEPEGFRIDPPHQTGAIQFVAAALLQMYREASLNDDLTYTDLLTAITGALGVASQAEALAGTSNLVTMTPLRT